MIRIIGDIHGFCDIHTRLVSDCEYSIQLGDLGVYNHLSGIDSNKHKFIAGNHENYKILKKNPPKHYLGPYGIYEVDGKSIFFISGAYSIDKDMRLIMGLPWYKEEELNYETLLDVIELYKKTRPDYVISHECPFTIVGMVGNFNIKTRTNMALDSMLDFHKPIEWMFGHYHKEFYSKIGGTGFRCVNQYCYYDL